MKVKFFWVSVLALVVVSVSSCSSKPGGAAGNMTDAPQSAMASQSEGEASPRSTVQTQGLGRLLDLIVAEAAQLPRAEFDPAALAATLGKDPQAHFDWVRDHTWWVPYRGLLRGSTGVMLDRVGSNLDRAVLLGDLLRRSGYTVRLAHAQLTDGRARELLGKVAPLPDRRRRALAPRPDSAERARALEVVMPGHGKALQLDIEASRRITGEARALVRSEADQLFTAVRVVAAAKAMNGDRRAIAAMRDHWWVERQDGDRWIAMDMLLPDARIGTRIADAASTSEWKPADRMPAIPADDWHTVTIRVVVERYKDGNTSESTILEKSLRPALVFNRPITLHHLPRPWPDRFPDSSTDPNARGNAAVAVKEWVPYLVIGNEFVAQSGFTDGGDLIGEPFGAKRDIAKTGGASMMGGFNEALSGGETLSSYMTAEWIDYEIRVPGDDVEELRRPVFDLLGPVNRSQHTAGFDASTNDRLVVRYESLLSSTDILLQPCELTGSFVADLKSAGIVAKQAALRSLDRERERTKAREDTATLLSGIDLWGPLPQLALWRAALGRDSGETFIGRPNVLNYRATLPIVSANRAPMREVIDVAANSTFVRGNTALDAFQARLEQGVADTVAEILTVSKELRMSENAASVFAIVNDSKSEIRLFKPYQSDGVKELDLPPDTAARLAAAVASGYVAVAPTRLVQLRGRQSIGWWRVDPTSGETVGVMDTGYHGEAEDAELRAQLSSWHQKLLDIHLDNASRMEAARTAETANDLRQLGLPLSPEMEADLALFRLTTQLLERVANYMMLLG